jgi:beta-galactosidase
MMIKAISKFLCSMKVVVTIVGIISLIGCSEKKDVSQPRERISINEDWYFFKYESVENADDLIYDVRPELTGEKDHKVADAKPTEAIAVSATEKVLKPWILPAANEFIKDESLHHIRPEGNPGGDFPFVKNDFDDRAWTNVDLPHDWAINRPFQTGGDSEVGGGMGRLPVNGVAWYRNKLNIPASNAGKSIFLEIDGAMSYAVVWLNGQLVGGWPYGYNSWRLDLTPYIVPGGANQLAIRLDNPNHSARWYPGGGIYRNVWLVKTEPIHVDYNGTYIATNGVSAESAMVNLEVTIANDTKQDVILEVSSEIYYLDEDGNKEAASVASIAPINIHSKAGKKVTAKGSTNILNPKLWGPKPIQTPHLYVAVTNVVENGKIVDTYETRFGVRTITFDPEKGLFVNDERIFLKGVNQHHDLGALGAAFNVRAAERQLEMLREMGCNAIRMSHNPPAPELLALTDRMGFLVIDEIFDSWERKKTPHDFHLIFPDWSEADTRTFIRRDRNHPSIIMWSFGNEVGEQYTGAEGAAVAQRLYDFVREEDPTRPTTLAMNFAKPDMELPVVPDVIGLNYQGEGIRQDPEFEGTDRIRTASQYDAFHEKFPNKVIYSSETASAFSSRGVYTFPVENAVSSPARDGRGGDSKIQQISSYELYAVDFGSSADRVFGTIDRHPFVAGEFVWTGWDYIGEPTPYYESRSSYNGIIDLAGFKKNRFWLYQAHWMPDFPMAHILPHWNWPERVGLVTPVHVFTSGDEAELFLNGKSLGRKVKGEFEYRIRWDDVKYEAGELKVIAYKEGKEWAEDVVKTTSEATALRATVDRNEITADGDDLAFLTIEIVDKDGLNVPNSNALIKFSIEGAGEIVATDNGDATNMVSFASHTREAFNGLCLVIVKSKKGKKGEMKLTAESVGLTTASMKIVGK